MLFNSLEFLIFFPAVTLLFFASPQRWRWLVLLVASCWFYMSFVPKYILILAFTIAVDYVAGIAIEAAPAGRRRLLLTLSILANVGVLAVFKYYNFFNDNLAALARALGWNYGLGSLSLVLPIGLSFHTFQSLSYTIEVYRGRQRAERHPGIFALYVMFYPQLVAGPIERPQNLLRQLRERFDFDPRRVRDGLLLMAWGLFKKVVIADRLAIYVNAVYAQPDAHPGWPALLATYFFAFQIYCDFSGYSDIALGAAQVMGFRLMNNFHRPYFAASLMDFWRRWHISLSSWFRDYLYIPLGGNRVPRLRQAANLMIVFLVSGLWHGAAWTFVVWGLLHGAYIVVGHLTANARERFAAFTGLVRHPRLRHGVRVFCVFQLVALAWVFFRAESLANAAAVLGSMTRVTQSAPLVVGLSPEEFAVALASLVFLECVHLLQRHWHVRHFLADRPLLVRWAVAYALVIGIVLFGEFNSQPFIYFQF